MGPLEIKRGFQLPTTGAIGTSAIGRAIGVDDA